MLHALQNTQRLQGSIPVYYSALTCLSQLTAGARHAQSELAADDMEDRLAALEKEDRIEQLLADLKAKRA